MIGPKTIKYMEGLTKELLESYTAEMATAYYKSDDGLKVSVSFNIIPSKTRHNGVDVSAVISFTAERVKERRDDNQAAVEEAQARAEAPVFVVPDTPRAEPTKVKGASTRYEYVPEVVNKTTLLRAIAAGKVPETVIDINMGQLKRYVNMVKQAVPGVVCTEKAVVSGRAR